MERAAVVRKVVHDRRGLRRQTAHVDKTPPERDARVGPHVTLAPVGESGAAGRFDHGGVEFHPFEQLP